MRIADMNWQQVESYLQTDDRCVVPIGSTEQHAQLSLCVDAILAEKVATEAAEPLGVPVFPSINYGVTPHFTAFPGTVTISLKTLLSLVSEIVGSVYETGFRRVLIVNGHGGNAPVGVLAQEMMMHKPELAIKFVNWYSQPAFLQAAKSTDPFCSHANWFENFPWTRLPNVPTPEETKDNVDTDLIGLLPPQKVRSLIGDGSYGGVYRKADGEMLKLWEVGVEETRAALQGPWPNQI